MLLERHGILTRAAATSENTDGGFTPIYRILTHAEETGNIRRGYFIEGLGASQ
ncbi:Lhr family helicase, partial [Dermatophilus congolensis]|uniref:Lhr family helicase n=1 Tax=Dermatophilus congolensis TaxID=1863 RepID=UPI003C7D0200